MAHACTRRARVRDDVRRLPAQLACIAAALVSCASFAQNPQPLPNPNLYLWDSGIVRAVLRLPDGSVVVGGEFTSVYEPSLGLSIPRANLAKFTAAGGLDLQWDPRATGNVQGNVAPGSVDALAYDAVLGAVYVGGNFNAVGGLGQVGVARVSATGTGQLDAAWRPQLAGCGASSTRCVRALALDASRRLLVGGEFTSIDGVFCRNLARILPSGGSDGFAPAPYGPATDQGWVEALAIDASGSIFAGGSFTDVRGVAVGNLARVSPSGTGAADPAWNPATNSYVTALAIDESGALLVGGNFSSIGGVARRALARVASGGTGAVDAAWNPAPTLLPSGATVHDFASAGAGALYVAGDFASIGGQSRKLLARIATTGAGLADTAFDAAPNGAVYALAAAPGGAVIAGGRFTRIGGQPAFGVARLGTTGSFAAGGFTQRAAQVRAIALSPDGSAFVGGAFARAGGGFRASVLKLAPDGTLDATWAPAIERAEDVIGNAEVLAFAISPDGATVYVGGEFTTAGGLPMPNLAKLAATGVGTVDAGWQPAPGGRVSALALAPSGSLVVGGWFQEVAGTPRRCLARVDASGVGALDATWNPHCIYNDELPVQPRVTALAVDGSGLVYAGGLFLQLGGTSRNFMARLSPSGTGAADPAWLSPLVSCATTPTARCVEQIQLDGAGGVYVAGGFSTNSGRARLARLSAANGAVDTAFTPGPNGGDVLGIALDGAGSVFAAGAFDTMQFQPWSRLAKLSAATGVPDARWTPGANLTMFAVAYDAATQRVLVGGSASTIGGLPRQQLAALPPVSERIFGDGFE
jgi:hypothetical protein